MRRLSSFLKGFLINVWVPKIITGVSISFRPEDGLRRRQGGKPLFAHPLLVSGSLIDGAHVQVLTNNGFKLTTVVSLDPGLN